MTEVWEAIEDVPVERVDLTPVFTDWYADVDGYVAWHEHEHIIEIFDEFLVVVDHARDDWWRVPYIQSETSGRVVYGPRDRVTLDYLFEGEEVVRHLVDSGKPVSRPVSGRACIVTLTDTGETICSVTDGFVSDDAIADIVAKLEEPHDDRGATPATG